MSTFKVGDRVKVLRSVRLPEVEDVMHEGVIQRITTNLSGDVHYWIEGVLCSRTARELRPCDTVQS